MNNKTQTVKDITEIGILVGLAIVLDTFIKVPVQIAGGSINFSMIPLFLIALRHGPIKSLIASGLCFGLVTCLIDAYGILTYPFDYLIAFGGVSLLGIFGKKINYLYNKDKKGIILSYLIVIGLVLLQGIIRLLSSAINGVIIYKLTYLESIIYGLTYIPLTVFSNIIIMCLLLPIIIKLNKRYQTNYLAG